MIQRVCVNNKLSTNTRLEILGTSSTSKCESYIIRIYLNEINQCGVILNRLEIRNLIHNLSTLNLYDLNIDKKLMEEEKVYEE